MAANISNRAGRREWLGLAVIALPCVLYSMDLTVLNLAVPHLSADLKPTAAQLRRLTHGLLVVAGAILILGQNSRLAPLLRPVYPLEAWVGLASSLARSASRAPCGPACRSDASGVAPSR